MSRKNHKMVNGKLLQTDKPFGQLKQKQKTKISQWLYEEYAVIFSRIGKPPDSRWNDEILWATHTKIEEAEIWIPFYEVQKYFYSHKNAFRKRYLKSKARLEETNDIQQED